MFRASSCVFAICLLAGCIQKEAARVPLSGNEIEQRSEHEQGERYVFVFSGRAAKKDTRFVLRDLRPLKGHALRDPVISTSIDEQPPVDEFTLFRFDPPLLGFAPGALEFPLNYVDGRRYVVFYGTTTDMVPVAMEQKAHSFVGVLRVVDLDETLAESRIRAAYRRGSGSRRLPAVRAESATERDLTAFVAKAQQVVRARELSVGDIVDALGIPNGLVQIGVEGDQIATQAIFLFATRALTRRTETRQGTRTLVSDAYPAIVVNAVGNSVTKVERVERTNDRLVGGVREDRHFLDLNEVVR